MKLHPIIIFAYNRSHHINILLNSLKRNYLFKKSKVIVFSDGPKNEIDKDKIDNLRILLKKKLNPQYSEIIESNSNLGLSRNIIGGLKQVFKIYDSAIILEDDLEVSPYFLNYMNDGLNLYASLEKVASIHGYMYPIHFNKKIPEYFFIKGADCWGWGTWRRAWKKFEPSGSELKKKIDLKKNKKEFNFDNSYDYYQMLVNQINGKNSSWAIRWYASAFLNNMLTLYPRKTLVKNNGRDNSGTHGSGIKKLQINQIFQKKYVHIKHTLKVIEHVDAKKELINYLKKKSDNFFIKFIKSFYYLVR